MRFCQGLAKTENPPLFTLNSSLLNCLAALAPRPHFFLLPFLLLASPRACPHSDTFHFSLFVFHCSTPFALSLCVSVALCEIVLLLKSAALAPHPHFFLLPFLLLASPRADARIPALFTFHSSFFTAQRPLR
jgi:hypothetical protein